MLLFVSVSLTTLLLPYSPQPFKFCQMSENPSKSYYSYLKTPSNENHVFHLVHTFMWHFSHVTRQIRRKVSSKRHLWVFLPSNCWETITDLSARFETRVASLCNQFLTNPAPDGAGRCGYKSPPLMRRRRYAEKQLSGSQQWGTNTPVLLWVVKREEKNLRGFIFYQRTWKSESNGWISFPEIIVVGWKFQIKRRGFALTIFRRTAKKDGFATVLKVKPDAVPSVLPADSSSQHVGQPVTIPLSLFFLLCANEMRQSLPSRYISTGARVHVS